VRVLDSSDNLLAALFVKGNASGTPGEEDIYTQSGTDGAKITPLVGPLTASSATIPSPWISSTAILTSSSMAWRALISPSALVKPASPQLVASPSHDNLGGGNQGIFGNFSVVPEPASIGMIGLGGLALLFRRPKRPA